MRPNAAARRTRYLQMGIPAAVLGALSGAVAAVPASAHTPPHHVQPFQPVAGGSASRVAPAATTPATYIVQPGDTVSAIAGRFGLRTVDVLAWNGLSWRSVIKPGQSLTLTGSITPATTAPAPAPATGATHVVAAGDTVFGIAQQHGTTVDAVLAANGLTRASVIFPGQTLYVSTASAAAPAVVTTTSTAPVSPPPLAADAQSHVVAAGDTLFGIAQRYGTTTSALFAMNGLSSESIIYPGQSIFVAAVPATVAPASVPVAPMTPLQSHADLDAEQAGNAGLIIGIGRQLGVSDRAIALALATAMVESGMRNLGWGDRDSLGLFQQRPSTGWGTPEQVSDADRATRAFFGGAADPNGQLTRGLLDIPGWEGMSFTDAAQAVQISAYPERYGQWETQAFQWLATYG